MLSIENREKKQFYRFCRKSCADLYEFPVAYLGLADKTFWTANFVT